MQLTCPPVWPLLLAGGPLMTSGALHASGRGPARGQPQSPLLGTPSLLPQATLCWIPALSFLALSELWACQVQLSPLQWLSRNMTRSNHLGQGPAPQPWPAQQHMAPRLLLRPPLSSVPSRAVYLGGSLSKLASVASPLHSHPC